jgi:hypothetical protein
MVFYALLNGAVPSKDRCLTSRDIMADTELNVHDINIRIMYNDESPPEVKSSEKGTKYLPITPPLSEKLKSRYTALERAAILTPWSRVLLET